VAVRSDPMPTEAEMNLGSTRSLFLDQLVEEMRGPSQTRQRSATRRHSSTGTTSSFTGSVISEVVHEFIGRRLSVHHRTWPSKACAISTDDFRTLNRCLDDAIAGARHGVRAPKADVPSLGTELHQLEGLTNAVPITAFEVLQHGDG